MEEAGSQVAKLSIIKDSNDSDYNWCSKNQRIVYSITIGNNLPIESINTTGDATTSHWVAKVRRISPSRRPIIAGLCAYRVKADPKAKKKDLPVSLISLCVGSHCLLLPINYESRSSYWRRPLPHPVLSFLTSTDVKIVGLGIKKVEETLERDWGVKLKDGIELATLVENFWKEGEKPAKRLEDMAIRILDGLRVPRRPGRLEFRGGYGWDDDEEEEEMMYATVDAYLASQIGAKVV